MMRTKQRGSWTGNPVPTCQQAHQYDQNNKQPAILPARIPELRHGTLLFLYSDAQTPLRIAAASDVLSWVVRDFAPAVRTRSAHAHESARKATRDQPKLVNHTSTAGHNDPN